MGLIRLKEMPRRGSKPRHDAARWQLDVIFHVCRLDDASHWKTIHRIQRRMIRKRDRSGSLPRFADMVFRVGGYELGQGRAQDTGLRRGDDAQPRRRPAGRQVGDGLLRANEHRREPHAARPLQGSANRVALPAESDRRHLLWKSPNLAAGERWRLRIDEYLMDIRQPLALILGVK